MALLATRTVTGIQQSPVLVRVDGEGRVTVSSRETAYENKTCAPSRGHASAC
jgi:hypothetical protein